MRQETDEELRAEADRLLASGLRQVLSDYGKIHIIGSYTLQLMVWRDLDIVLEMPGIDRKAFFELGSRISQLLQPFKMFLTDYTVGPNEYDFHGLYWGIRLGDLRQGAWKIDLHAEDRQRSQRMVEQCEALASRLTPDCRRRILTIKSTVWNHPAYRKTVTSQDVYDAVLDHAVTTVDEFWAYINRRGRSQAEEA
jgi:hypothetical protein